MLFRKKLFDFKKFENAVSSATLICKDIVPIYRDGAVPNLEGFEEMSELAIDAYPCQRGTQILGDGDFSDSARRLAVLTVAKHFGVSEQQAIDLFTICIVPHFGFHGKIMAKRKG